NKKRRVPGTKLGDYLSILQVMTASSTDTLAMLNKDNPLYRRFWEPLIVGALNTEPEIASAELLRNIFVQSFGAGGAACIPMIPKVGLSESFVTPCLNVLRQHGVEIKYYHRLRSLLWEKDSVRELDFNGNIVEVAPQDWVI